MKGCDCRNQTKLIFQKMKLLTLSDIYFRETAKCMHRIHYRQYNITYELYKTAASIHQHYARYSDNDKYYLQSANLFLG